MKRIILALLIVLMVATPCLAQEIETDELFSVEGTLWREYHIFNLVPQISTWGFYEGRTYDCSMDGSVCSFCFNSCYPTESYTRHSVHLDYWPYSWDVRLGLHMMNNRFGFFIGFDSIKHFHGSQLHKYTFLDLGYLFRVDDNWIPSEDFENMPTSYRCPSIYP